MTEYRHPKAAAEFLHPPRMFVPRPIACPLCGGIGTGLAYLRGTQWMTILHCCGGVTRWAADSLEKVALGTYVEQGVE
jgi:hypothetical protein